MKWFLFCIITIHSVNAQNLETGPVQDEEFGCPTNVPLIENECNKCFCTTRGELACTAKLCPQNRGRNLENCKNGTSWLKNCNKCWCIPIGTVCTNLDCNAANY